MVAAIDETAQDLGFFWLTNGDYGIVVWHMPEHPRGQYPPQGFDILRQIPDRSVEELNDLLMQREQRAVQEGVLDEAGKTLCAIDVDPETEDVIAIHPARYKNIEGVAEQVRETVYVTDEDGNITDERLTRKEVRAQGKRYLIVTTLLCRGEEVLIQQRSPHKSIDPSKKSTSAHGVAKEVFAADGSRVTDGPRASLINAALETNEELRHDTDPFRFSVWPGTYDELMRYAKEKKFNDPETVWLVPMAYLPDDGYPLGAYMPPKQRTRALLAGVVFSDQPPSLSIDPSELSGFEWKKWKDIFQESNATRDLPSSALHIMEKIIYDSRLVKDYGRALGDNMIRRLLGETIEKP